MDTTSATAGTILKYSLVSGSWTANGSYTTSFGGFGLAARKNGSGADLFVTTGTGATSANSLIKLNDTAGHNSTISVTTANNVTLYTAASGTVLKGVAFTPVAVSTPTITGGATATALSTTYGTASTAQTFSISGSNLTASITATAPTGFEVSSDGTTYGSTATFTQSGGSASGTLSVRLAATAPVTGSYNSQNIALTSTGATTVNITTPASGNTVTAKALTINGLTGNNKVYNGTAAATVTGTAAYSGLVNGETFSVTGTPSFTFADAAVGSAKTITVTGYTAPSTNYSLTQPSLTADITTAALTVTANNVTKVFGASLTSITGSTAFTSSGLVNGETIGSVTITYGSGAATGDPVGSYAGAVVPSAASGGTFAASNYAIAYVAGGLTVSAAPSISPSGTPAAVSAIYGSASAVPTSFSVSAGNLTGDLTVTAPTGFEVSTASSAGYGSSLTLVATGGTVASTTVYIRLGAANPAGNYSGSVSISGGGATAETVSVPSSTVSPKALTVTGLSGVNRVYDGGTSASLAGTAAYDGLENGETFSVVGTPAVSFGSAGVGSGKSLTVTGFQAPSANYSVTQPTGLTADITAKALTLSGAAVATKAFDGTTAATITGTLTGVIAPDVVTLNGTGTFASANAGTGIAVTSTSTLGGAGAGNYTLTQPTGLTGTITGSTNANLTALAISPGQIIRTGSGTFGPGFATSSTDYLAFLANGATSVTVTPTLADSNATVTVNGNSAGTSVALSEGANTITVLVTAQDTTTTKTYTITAYRSAAALTAGSIAFTGFNADGNDDIAFVALTTIPQNSVIFLSDNEWNGSAIGSGGAFNDFNESEMVWVAPTGGLAAGSIVVLNNISTTPTANTGTVLYSNQANRGYSTTAEAVYAFQGAAQTPEVFLAGITTDTAASFTNTGLTTGSLLTLASSSDGGRYKGARTGQSTFAGYLALIGNVASNWDDIANGDGTSYLPFSTTAFTSTASDSLVSISNASVTEGNSGTATLSFTVTRTNTAGSFTVAYATADGTATTADNDYVAASGTLTFTAGGAATQSISVTVNGDTNVEGDETMLVTLSGISNTLGTATLSNTSGTGTITNDEPTVPVITQQPSSQSLYVGAQATLTVAVTSSPAATLQWYQGASGVTTAPISGATGSSYVTPALSSTGSFWVRATNPSGSVDSQTATISVSYAPALASGSPNVFTPNTATWNPSGVTVNGTTFINLGLQGVGRVLASSTDPATGETLGSISDLQITGWTRNQDGTYSGAFQSLPDRGFNSASIFSNYAARINTFNFTFTPYTASTPTTSQNQIAMTFAGSTRFTYDHDGNSSTAPVYTTGLLADAGTTLFGTSVPVRSGNSTQSDGTVNNRLTLDSEGLILDSRPGKAGSGWIGDEYGAYIYHFNASKQIDGQVQLPAALIPRDSGGNVYFKDSPANTSGRRVNQGMEGIAQSPDGTRLFGLMQSALMQDSGASGNQNRVFTRLVVYDITGSDTPNDPVQQYVIQLPAVDSSGSSTNGSAVDRTAAQSAIIALNNTQLLILSRDGNGRGASGAPVFKSVLLADLSGATNIDGTYDSAGAAVAPANSLTAGVTKISWTEALNMLAMSGTSPELAKFGLNLNSAPGDIYTLCEKWEALALVSAQDSANPNDYFLFVANDNDFLTASINYFDASGTLQTYTGNTVENDTVVLAYRVRMTGFNQAPFLASAPSASQAAAVGTAFSFTLPSGTFVDPNDDSLTYSAALASGASLPAWLSFNPATRVLSGTPSPVDLGSIVVRLTATDGGSLSSTTDVTLTVSPASGFTYFPNSVASGDPRETSVVLWTRVLDGNTSVDRPVALRILKNTTTGSVPVVGATTELQGTNVWTGGTLTAQSAHDGVVKVKVTGLDADSTYFYQFTYNGQRSPIGRTRTAPAPGSNRVVKYAAINCNDYVGRYFNALKHLADQEADNIDFVLNLGDYIYETTGDASFQTTSAARAMVFSNPAEAISLGGGNYAAQSIGNYRDLYKTIRQDRQLQRVHELFPMISIWDDHEFSDDNWQDNATFFDGKVNEQQSARKRNGEQAWMEFLPTERGLATDGNSLSISSSILYPNTVIYDAFNFGGNLDLVTTDSRSNRADHLVPEQAFPATVPMDEDATVATLAAAYGMSASTFSSAVWPGIKDNFAPYVNIDNSAYAAVKAALQAIVSAGVSAELATLPSGQTAATTGSAYATANVAGNLDASFVNSMFAAAGQTQPFDATALAAMPRGLSFFLLGKTGFFSDYGSRYQVVNQTFQLYAGYTYQAFLASGGALGRNQALFGTTQQTFLGTALATSAAAGRTWRVVASSTPYTPIKFELGDLPTGVSLPTQGSISGVSIPASIPSQFLVEFLLNADEPSGFPQYRQGIVDLLAQYDSILVSGDIHAQLVGNNRASNGQKVVDFTVPSAASGEFRRAVSGAFAAVENLMTPSVRAATGLSGNFTFDTAQKQAVINATDGIIKKNTTEMFDADTATHGYTVFTAAPDAFTANFRKINVSYVDDNLYGDTSSALDALFTRQQYVVTKTGSGASTDLSLGVPTTVTPTVAANTGGSVSGGGEVVIGSAATFTATPAAGYRLLGWKVNGAAAGSTNPLVTTVTAGMTVEASFTYQVQILHFYGESGLLGITTAPIMGAMIDRFDDQYANTVILAEGDTFIPGPWLVAGADPSFNRL
ncbi:MAG: alkaline phosphatase D family protein, partial [Verrucomicrobia bacterium]|nr:alkaline phosphatase D family protein [Verrucomicrobiota bacterium]